MSKKKDTVDRSKKPEDADAHTFDTPGAPDVPAGLARKLGQATVGDQPSASKTSEHTSAPSDTDGVPSDVEAVIESRQTDEAVEDIVRKESDDLLKTYDAQAAAAQTPVRPKRSRGKVVAWTVIVLILLAAVAAILVPKARYYILNTAGVRVKASVLVQDKTTGQPLKDVAVALDGATVQTDDTGYALLEGLRQGEHTLTIERIAFAKVEQRVTLGWGSNPLGTYQLTPAGGRYTFVLKDYVSGKPLPGAQVSSGRASARANDKGEAILTLQKTNQKSVPVSISLSGYRTEQRQLLVSSKDPTDVVLVPAIKTVFAARPDGLIHIYSMYIDGKDRATLLPGTGKETDDVSLATSADGSRAAIVSTRESISAEDGTLLRTLTLADIANKTTKTLDRGTSVKLIDWIGTALLYQIVIPGDASTSNRLVSYDYATDKRIELVKTSGFRAVASAQGSVYFSGSKDTVFNVINLDGSDKRRVLDQPVVQAVRSAYNTLHLRSASGSWFALRLDSDTIAPADPSNSTVSQQFIASPDGRQSLFVQDSKLNVLTHDSNKTVQVHAPASEPARWLHNHILLYRNNATDYVISTKGGDPRKVADVLATSGLYR